MCFHSNLYITLLPRTFISFYFVAFSRKADFFKVHPFSLRDVDLSPMAPSPSVLPEYMWSSVHLEFSD